jgi:hypothetical protein
MDVRAALVPDPQPAEAAQPGEGAFNGLITTDKFCLSRWGRLQLSWPRARAVRAEAPTLAAYPPGEVSHRGGDYETPVAGAAHQHCRAERATALGSRVPAPPAMGDDQYAEGRRLNRLDAALAAGGALCE